MPGFTGQPPLCRPQCLRNEDCGKDQACISDKCQNPCNGACGIEAKCRVINHVPRCTCPDNFNAGDPYEECFESKTTNNQTKQNEVLVVHVPEKPSSCLNQVCASNAECRISEISNQIYCQCISGYIGDPVGAGCRPQCLLNTECEPSQACINQKCVDPCLSNICGINARCTCINHFTICNCEPDYTGNPFEICTKICMCLFFA